MMPPVRRYGALEMLADHLNRSMGYGIPGAAPAGRSRISSLLDLMPYDEGIAHLPEAVQRSIQNEPSYGEGQMQQPQWSAPWHGYSDFERENDLNYDTWAQGGGRAARLPYELGMSRQFPEMGIPLQEGLTARPADTPDPYSPRPNLGLGRGGYPWALY